MGLGVARIETVADGDAALAAAVRPAEALVVPVRSSVPPWLASLVERAHAAGAMVTVSAEPAPELVGDALAGWEIGVCTAALSAGADEVTGMSARRVARVRAVLGALDDARSGGVEP